MSTKIYNGIKFKTNNIHKLYQQLIQLRPRFIENSNRALESQHIKLLYMVLKDDREEYDEVIKMCNESNNSEDLIYRIKYILNSALRENLMKRYRGIDDPDYEASIVVIPYKKSLYGLYYCDRIRENEDLIFTIADDYHYQNQTDKPDNISWGEWNKRREVWEDIFNNGGDIPSEFGFHFKITTEDGIKISNELSRKVYEHIMNNVGDVKKS